MVERRLWRRVYDIGYYDIGYVMMEVAYRGLMVSGFRLYETQSLCSHKSCLLSNHLLAHCDGTKAHRVYLCTDGQVQQYSAK